MSDTPVLTLFFGVSTACLVVLTVTIVVIACELRRTLRRVNTTLSGTDLAIREVHRSVQQIRRFLTKATGTVRQVEAVIHHACDGTSALLDRFLQFVKGKARVFWPERVRNGAGAEPRRHHRSR